MGGGEGAGAGRGSNSYPLDQIDALSQRPSKFLLAKVRQNMFSHSYRRCKNSSEEIRVYREPQKGDNTRWNNNNTEKRLLYSIFMGITFFNLIDIL
jgi:hypothetical protein